jgi:hypothetical protein
MRFQVEEKRRKANILNSMQQYVYDGAIVKTPLVRALLASLVVRRSWPLTRAPSPTTRRRSPPSR